MAKTETFENTSLDTSVFGESGGVRKCINVDDAEGVNFVKLFAEPGLLSKAELSRHPVAYVQ